MDRHDLTLEEFGYTHARLNQAAASTNPHYQRGYRQGEADRQNFQNFQNLQEYRLCGLSGFIRRMEGGNFLSAFANATRQNTTGKGYGN